jgi:hypothetical protein
MVPLELYAITAYVYGKLYFLEEITNGALVYEK